MTDESAPPPPPPPGPPADGGGSLFKQYGFIALYWLVFVGILGGMAALNEIYPVLVEVYFAEWTASVAHFGMRLMGWGGTVDGITITNPYCRFYIIGECTAYYPVAVYLAAVAAYPCPVLRKLLGVVIGVPIVLGFNIVRLVTLCYLFRMYPALFDAAHMLFWQSLMIFFTIVVWIIWVSTLAHPRQR